MSVTPISSGMMLLAQNAVTSVWNSLCGLLGRRNFSSDAALLNSPNIDPHFIPRVPMNNANLDMHLLMELGKMGMKRGKEITAQTHPELYHEWQTMCQRAGIGRVPQLIVAESRIPNAASLNNENAVVMTTELLKRLNLREVRAVLGHELGHEASNHTTPRALAMVLLGGGGLVAGNIFAKRGGFGAMINHAHPNPNFLRRAAKWLLGDGSEASSVLAAEVYMGGGALLGATMANQLTVRPTELDADRKGARISGDPEGLIMALNKLEDGHKKQGFIRFFHKIESGYPSTETRIERLREIANSMPAPVSAQPQPIKSPDPVAEPVAPGMRVHTVTSDLQAKRVEPALATHQGVA